MKRGSSLGVASRSQTRMPFNLAEKIEAKFLIIIIRFPMCFLKIGFGTFVISTQMIWEGEDKEVDRLAEMEKNYHYYMKFCILRNIHKKLQCDTP